MLSPLHHIASMLTTDVKYGKFFVGYGGRVCVRPWMCVCICVHALRIPNYQSPGGLACCDMVDLLAVALMNA